MKKAKLAQEGRGYEVFQIFNNLFFLLALFVTAYPVYYVLIASISDPAGLATNYGTIWLPLRPISFEAYRRVLGNPQVLSGYKNTLLILIGGLGVNMVMTTLGAYFLSVKDVMLNRVIGLLIVFTMYFSGGMIPAYLNIRDLGMIDTLWALILPGAINTYNMLILRSAFSGVPSSLIEAAHLDGANHLVILRHVMLPLSGATLAVLVLYYGVAHWNAWFTASIYINNPAKYPLALVLRNILIENQNADMLAGDTGGDQSYRDLIKYALIVVATLPILCLYPLLQRYFVKGIMVGALKG